MDLRRKDHEGLKGLAGIWKTTPGAELEAAVSRLDMTGWQDIIQGLRSCGMREAPQLVKLNITLANDIRFTLEGAGVIQAYCEDNRIAGKPFTAMVKEAIAGAQPVDIDYYGVRAKLKRETPLAIDDARIVEAISRWDSLVKYYRMIQRFEFAAPNGLGIRFDISVIRSGGSRTSRTFQEARVTSQASIYEAEVEVTASRDSLNPDEAVALLLRGISWMLQGQQRSFVLVSAPGSQSVLDGIQSIFKGPRGFKYPGPQPATLERQNIDSVIEPGVPNLRSVAYNVTDKADGLRCLLFVAPNGRIFLIDSVGRVYGTGKEVADQAGLVLDGEWIRRDRRGTLVSHYYAFDLLAVKGDKGVMSLPFFASGPSRHALMASAITALAAAKPYMKVPPAHSVQIGIKAFRTGENIFREAAVMLDDAASAPYNTDGLIFTPNASSLPLGRGSWPAQLKWKPASHNTIDFLVVTERNPEGGDLVGTRFREDSGSTVRHKILRLFVGSKKDAAFADPRATILGGEPLPSSLEDGDYRAVEFRPSEPRDPMAAICYVALGEGSSDPAGAAPAATRLDVTDEMRCDSGDVIQSNMIVEMSYHPERAPGWRWVPMRIRFDKTEKLQRGLIGGTMNADWVANSIWSSIHNPVTEAMVKTGEINEVVVGVPTTGKYYNRKAPKRDVMKTQPMRNFHNDYVKRDVLLRRTIPTGGALCDLAMGKAGDLHKWVSAGVGRVFGCDYSASNINDPQDGAYARLLSKMIEMGGRDKVAPMVFVQADAAVNLKSGLSGVTEEDKALLIRELATSTFDVVSCMFAIHYMFRDEATLHGFLTNLADLVKVGGYFVGCGFDGDAVAALLSREESVTGRDGDTDIWSITKRYGTAPFSATKNGLGMAIDVDFISIGETFTEFLVSWPYLQERLAEIGLELLSTEEQASIGLTASSQMFADALESAGRRYNMVDALKKYSFLNRWYIFKRIADKRPEPLSVMANVRPPVLTELKPTVTEAALGPAPTPENLPVLEVTEVSPFLINSANKEPDVRLGADLSDWPRYMSLGTLGGLKDLFTIGAGGGAGAPQTLFPSVEAAIAAAKFQVATDKPELGPQIFRTDGALHQKFETERQRLDGNTEAIAKTVDDQVAQTRILSGKAKIKSFKATWNQEAWDAKKEDVYKKYLAERYRVDDRFREMVKRVTAAAKENGTTVMLVNGTEPNELGVGLKDGVVVGGENKVGRWLMELV